MTPHSTVGRTLLVSCLVLMGGCGGSKDSAIMPVPLFPQDYASTYTEVRGCRQSTDHDLNRIRIVADPAALAPYRNRDAPFPVGAVVLKEEFELGDTTCSGPVKQWTVMARLADDSAPTQLDWHWQRVDKNRAVLTENESRCYGCHTSCGTAPDGYLGTCAVPERPSPFPAALRGSAHLLLLHR